MTRFKTVRIFNPLHDVVNLIKISMADIDNLLDHPLIVLTETKFRNCELPHGESNPDPQGENLVS